MEGIVFGLKNQNNMGIGNEEFDLDKEVSKLNKGFKYNFKNYTRAFLNLMFSPEDNLDTQYVCVNCKDYLDIIGNLNSGLSTSCRCEKLKVNSFGLISGEHWNQTDYEKGLAISEAQNSNKYALKRKNQ